MRKAKLWLMLGLVVVLVAAFVLPGCAPEEAEEEWPSGLTYGTSSMGSTYFILLSGAADMITKYVGVPTAAEATAGPAANVGLIEKREIDFGGATNLVLYQGWNGLAWAEGTKHQRMRAFAPIYPGTWHGMALKESGIKSIHDCDGKIVCSGPTATTPSILTPMVHELFGIEPAKYVALGWTDANSALRDGMVDVIQTLAGLPMPSFTEMATTHDVNIWGIPCEDIPELLEELPLLMETVIPANTLKGQTEELCTIAVWGFMLADKDLPDDLVYEVTKAIAEHVDELIAIHKSGRHIGELEAMATSVIPLHSGAIKYYEEIGIEIPDKLYPPEYKG